MKKKPNQFHRIFSNIDYRILIVFFVLIILGLTFYFIKLRKHLNCDEADFNIIAENYAVGEIIEFKNNTPNAQQWVWDFGDESPKEPRKSVLHKYDEPGIYNVKLVINGFCIKEKKIEIKDLGGLIDRAKLPQIIAPKIVEVDQPVYFRYKYYTDQTYSWEWSFGETGQIDNTKESPVYIYKTPGVRTVSLIVNGDVDYKVIKTIYVKPRPEFQKEEDTLTGYIYEKPVEDFDKPMGSPDSDKLPPVIDPIPVRPDGKSALKIAPDISKDQFELMIYQVANQSKEKEDFSEYLCNNYEIPVIVNEKKTISFSEFCNDITGKEIKIESLRLTKDNLKCIDGLSISYKVKKFIIWTKE